MFIFLVNWSICLILQKNEANMCINPKAKQYRLGIYDNLEYKSLRYYLDFQAATRFATFS